MLHVWILKTHVNQIDPQSGKSNVGVRPGLHIHQSSSLFPHLHVFGMIFEAKFGSEMSSISKLVSTALAKFESLQQIVEAHVPDQATGVRSNLTRFKLWAGSVGAHRSYGHRSLEYRLSGTSIIRGHVATLLDDVCKHLQEGWQKYIF